MLEPFVSCSVVLSCVMPLGVVLVQLCCHLGDSPFPLDAAHCGMMLRGNARGLASSADFFVDCGGGG